MRILQLCNKPPYPPLDGGAIGINNLSRGLIDCGNQLKVLAVETHKHPKNKNIPIEYFEKTNAEFVFIDTRIKPFQAFLNIFSSQSYNIQRFKSKKLEDKLIEILRKENFDIVIIESIFLSPYLKTIRKNSWAKVVLRAPNVEHIIWERLASEEKNFLKRKYLKLLAHRLRKAETLILNQLDAVFTVSSEDMKRLLSMGCKVPIDFIPTGIDCNKPTMLESTPLADSVFHIGAMDWLPNIEGIEWFVKEVWPSVVKCHPKARLFLAGRSMPPSFNQYASTSVIIEGEVKDAAAFMANKGIMVVPLFSGSGMRVKIIEGMMMRKAIITTPVGIEGIIHEAGKDVIIANNAEEFRNAILSCLQHPEKSDALGSQAEITARLHYDNQMLAQKNHLFLEQILKSTL